MMRRLSVGCEEVTERTQYYWGRGRDLGNHSHWIASQYVVLCNSTLFSLWMCEAIVLGAPSYTLQHEPDYALKPEQQAKTECLWTRQAEWQFTAISLALRGASAQWHSRSQAGPRRPNYKHANELLADCRPLSRSRGKCIPA